MKKAIGTLTLASLLIAACSDTKQGPQLSRQELMDPETCKGCHERQYREWSGSMHAYAADDPVFLAMNQRGQEETNGELGSFCVDCHAPMAVREGVTTNGLNMEEVPQHLKGVTCYFCHNVDKVGTPHNNNPLELANDKVMRGGFRDPVPNSAHASAYAPHLDGSNDESATMCGSCHDIVMPEHEVHLERTFSEWKESPVSEFGQSCIDCHMNGRKGVAAAGPDAPSNVRSRGAHSHLMVGVDTAFETFPEDDPAQMELQRRTIECELEDALQVTEVCVRLDPNVPGRHSIDVALEASGVGHSWPSGATQDRRGWLEVKALNAEGDVLLHSGNVAEGEALTTAAKDDPFLAQATFRDHVYGESGEEVHMFWEAAKSEMYPKGYESNLIYSVPVSHPELPHQKQLSYQSTGEIPSRIELLAHIRPMGLEVIQSLVDSGHLDPAIRDQIPTFDLRGTRLSIEIDPEEVTSQGEQCIEGPQIDDPLDCVCLYEKIAGDGEASCSR